jgi:homocitrate synthase NifV
MLIDSTLREGAQMYGVYFSDSTRERILAHLIHAGVEEVEVGWVGQDGLAGLLGHARRLAAGTRTRITVWSRARTEDLRTLAEMGAQRVHFSLPVSDAHIQLRLGSTREKVLRTLRRILSQAETRNFSSISLGLEDISRADLDFALQVAQVARECGAQRVRLSDSVGLLTPLRTAELIRCFAAQSDLEIGFHGHNDFGMATANAITALQAGAHCVDVSSLGIGERSGIAVLEQVCAHRVTMGLADYDQRELAGLARLVSQAAGIPIARNTAIVGPDIFACESGLHLHGMARDPALFEPFAPEMVDANRKLGVGMKSGRAAVAAAVQRLGMFQDNREMEDLATRVRTVSKQLARPLNDHELLELARS